MALEELYSIDQMPQEEDQEAFNLEDINEAFLHVFQKNTDF